MKPALAARGRADVYDVVGMRSDVRPRAQQPAARSIVGAFAPLFPCRLQRSSSWRARHEGNACIAHSPAGIR
jgi:hypothetical protein